MLKNFVRKTSLRKKMRFYDKVIQHQKILDLGHVVNFPSVQTVDIHGGKHVSMGV